MALQLKNINDEDLNQKIKSLASQERKLTKEIILHIAEVDQRRLYLRMAYSSLFEYLVHEIGYSEGAAMRRIDAARMVQNIPEVSIKIESGEINLSQISKVQKICRQLKKENRERVAVSMQREALKKIESKSASQTDLILAQEFQVEVKAQTRLHLQKDESVRLEICFTKEEMLLIQKAREILSNKTGGGIKEALVEMAERVVKSVINPNAMMAVNLKKELNDAANQTEPLEKAEQLKKMEQLQGVDQLQSKVYKSITPKLKRSILNRDQCCQFQDAKTGKVCGSKVFLEIDHIQPRYKNGQHTAENLRVLCRAHNLFRFDANL